MPNLFLTDGAKGMKGAIEKAKELAETDRKQLYPKPVHKPCKPWLITEQQQVLKSGTDTDGKVDIFVAGVGTGGTVTGVGQYLKVTKP